MKSGFIAKDKARDELIAGTERGGELPPEDDPSDGPVESETEAGGEPVSAEAVRPATIRAPDPFSRPADHV